MPPTDRTHHFSEDRAPRAVRTGTPELSYVLEHLGAAVLVARLTDRRIVASNQAACELLGFDQGDLIGRDLCDLISSGDRERAVSAYESLRSGGSGQIQLERRYHCRDGDRIWGRASISVAAQRENQEALILEVVHETTEWQQAIERLRLTQFSLDRAGEAVFWLNSAGGYIYANDGACRLLGYTPDELQSMRVDSVDTLMSADSWKAYWERVRDTRSARDERTYRGRDGSDIPVEVYASHLSFGSQEYVFQFVHDVADRKSREKELIDAHQEAEQLSQLKSAFLTNVSHEIRTPLAAIIGFAAILDEEVEEGQRKFVRYIERSGKRLMDTLNSILNLAMLEAGTYRLQPEYTDVADEISDAIAMHRPLADEKGVELIWHPPTAPVSAYLDRGALNRVVSNVVGNAVKFTDEGRVEVLLSDDPDRLVLTVEDTGCGMKPEFIERAFEEFKQQSVGSERTHEGMGLGLTITRRLADLMRGTVDIESESSAGTRVTLTLPVGLPARAGDTERTPDRAADAARPTMDGDSDSADTGGDRPLVLAVEDNPDMLALMRLQLSRRCDVVGAESGSTALRLAAEKRFDLVLMDINLGEESGVDVLHELRTMNGYAAVPVIAVTAYALPGDRDRLLESGFDGYVGKPFTKKQLFGAMDRALAD